MKLFVYVAAVCVLLHAVFATDESFTYDDVAGWVTDYPNCGGSAQSPIDIDTDDTEYMAFDEFVLTGFSQVENFTESSLTNNGHTFELTLSGSYSVSGAGLGSTYVPAQFHFHWGSVSSQGSEHTIDGEEFPAEMHIVCLKEGLTSAQALSDSTGIAVLGFHIEVSSSDNAAFAPLVDNIQNLGSNFSDFIVLEDLLPNDLTTFYRYQGSLTTPTCNEAVVWTLFETPIKLSEDQLDILRTLEDSDNHTLSDNYRSTQDVNDRVIYISNSGTVFTCSLLALLFAAILNVSL